MASIAKRKVYVETTVIGHLVGRILKDPVVAGRQVATRIWWPIALANYDLLVSGVVLDECAAGDPVAAAERLTAITSLGILPASAEADHLTRQFLRKNAFPPNEPRDAAHVSLAAVNGLEYLVTWNFRHIANAETRSLIESVCRESGYEPPTICTPDELPGA